MESLEHEDLLIKLRAKLNEDKIKLWESPYVSENSDISDSLKELSVKYGVALKLDTNLVQEGLHELQLHSIERSKANEEFKETGCATLRLKATVPGEKPRTMKIVKPLNIVGEDLISSISDILNIPSNRIKLIYNGKLINRNNTLEEQGVKNGVQIMALVMAASPEVTKKEDKMYMEMKSTMDDATLLTDYDLADTNEYIKLEDQSGQAVELPPGERKALMVGLALHERGRAASEKKDYALALVLLLEADRQLSECRSSILSSVDNCAILQLDIAWCYLALQNISSAGDASARLARAERAFIASYGEHHQRLIALKGSNANERVLFMRLYLLQGIVAYHQNKRAEARALLEKSEAELNYLRVDESSVAQLVELGWEVGQARAGLRAARGDLSAAHRHLEQRQLQREDARLRHHYDRASRLLGACTDGSPVNASRLRILRRMGVKRSAALKALQQACNDITTALQLAREDRSMDDGSDDDMSSTSPEESAEPDNRQVAQLGCMGYPAAEAAAALRVCRGDLAAAVEVLAAGWDRPCDTSHPSTSAEHSERKKQKLENKEKRRRQRREREMALRRLQQSISSDEDHYLSSSLAEEEQFLNQYKSLLF